MAEVYVGSVAYQLFHTLWNCSIPEMYLYDQKYLEQVGTISTGDRNVDRQQQLNRRDIRLSGAAMALYFDEGAPIRLADPKDAMHLYRLILEHLENWKQIIQTELNIGNPPIDDLKKFDNLAAALYPIANQFAEFKPHQRGIFEHLYNIGWRSPISLTAPPAKEEHTSAMADASAKKEKPSGHNPVADAIARQMFKRNN